MSRKCFGICQSISVMSNIEFRYNPINLDRPAIRLARLRKGYQTDDIWLHLFDAYLDEIEDGGVPYESLSYVWGGTEKKAKVWVSGRMLGITENLYIALHHLRLQHTDRILWIDAICVDQCNLRERAHQVNRMSEIYQKADRVVVWLGPGNRDTDILMDFLNALPQNIAKVNQDVLSEYQKKAATCPGHNETLNDLLHRPWFGRIWIVQEVANAKRAIVLCGNRSVSTRRFVAAPSVVGTKPDYRAQVVLDVMPGHLRETSWWSQNRDLRTLLLKFRENLASDERDMVYALLGLVSNTTQPEFLQADYQKDVRELIRDTVFMLLFPEHLNKSADYFLSWTWCEFSQKLENLSSAIFLDALSRGDARLCQFIELDDIDVNWRDEEHRTILSWAAGRGSESMVEQLLNTGKADIDSKDKSGRTPLSWAANNIHYSVVMLLLEDGADVNSKDENGRTLLETYGRTWLLWAAKNGHKAVVKLLLETGKIDVNSFGVNGYVDGTPLLWAAKNGHEAVVKLLLETDKIDVNSFGISSFGVNGYEDRTPLLWAAENGHEAVVKLLLETGKIDAGSKDGGTRALGRSGVSGKTIGVGVRGLHQHNQGR